MANVKTKTKRHKSALKEQRKSQKRQSFNRGIKVRINKKIKEFKALLSHKNYDSANKLLSEIFSLLDKAAKRNTIHWKKAARKKSELSLLLKNSLENQK
jgi:small subunit ribosomal protein S20